MAWGLTYINSSSQYICVHAYAGGGQRHQSGPQADGQGQPLLCRILQRRSVRLCSYIQMVDGIYCLRWSGRPSEPTLTPKNTTKKNTVSACSRASDRSILQVVYKAMDAEGKGQLPYAQVHLFIGVHIYIMYICTSPCLHTHCVYVHKYGSCPDPWAVGDSLAR